MVKAEVYKGINFIRISKLPEDESNQIREWGRKKKITILAENEAWRDCIQYKDYKYWYENHFRPVPPLNIALRNESKPAPKRNFVFGISRIFDFLITRN